MLFISRGRNNEIHHQVRCDFCWRKLKGEFLHIKILSSDLRHTSFLSTVVYISDRSCISITVKESVLFHTRSNMTMFRMLLIIVCLSEVY